MLRPHEASHYVSLFRFDDVLLANTHAYGIWACHSPVIQLHRASPGMLFDFYARSFDGAWRRWGQAPTQASDCEDPRVRATAPINATERIQT